MPRDSAQRAASIFMPRMAQQVMRHSDARLTEMACTDVNLLPIFAELRKVKVPSLGASLNFGKTRPNPSQPVQTEVIEVGASTGTEAPENEGESLELATVGTPWPVEQNGGEGGIRTHGTLSGTPDFESGTIDHSATSPKQPTPSIAEAANGGTRKRRPHDSKRKPKIIRIRVPHAQGAAAIPT